MHYCVVFDEETASDLKMLDLKQSERGAERAKYSRSAERVFIQRPERSLCLAPVPLQYRSHHEPRACTNPPRIHLCLQQLTKLSAYTSKIVRCEGEMEFVKYFQKQTDRSYRCTIPVKKKMITMLNMIRNVVIRFQ